MGPTASGKTDLALKLRQYLPVEIISVDSALIYKEMDIGTAKPKKSKLNRSPHRLIDILDPSQSYSVARFRREALLMMDEVVGEGKIPLLVGGTMLYFKALLEGLSPLPASDTKVRQEIKEEASALGWGGLHDMLKRVDPTSAKKIHPNDSQRISRALEIYRVSGQVPTTLRETRRDSIPYSIKQFAIAPQNRIKLRHRINLRFQQMIETGFEDEVRKLHSRSDLHQNLPSMRCVGYRQLWDYLDSRCTLEEAIRRGVSATCQLAKRQMTWLRSWQDLTWLSSEDVERAVRKITHSVSASHSGGPI